MDILSTLVDASLATERVRIQTQIRKSHLALDGRDDEETDKLLEREIDLEEYVDGRVALLVNNHVAAPWFLRVRGIGKENIGKVIGPIDILKCTSVSTMWKFAGYAPVPVDVTCQNCGKTFTPVFEPAPEDEDVRRDVARCPKCGTMNPVKWVAEKRIKGGGKLHYNSQLRTMCYRLGTSILRAGLRQKCENDHIFGSANEKCPKCGSTNFKPHALSRFAEYYMQEKAAYEARYAAAGVKIIPADQLPLVDGKHTETPGLISEGHVHNQAMRKMIKLFLSCLWVTWRTSLKLPVTNPYPIDIQKHTHLIDPWSMVDREKPVAASTKKEVNKASMAYRIAIILGIDSRKVEAAWAKAQYEIEAERAKTEPLETSKPKFGSEPDTES